MDIYKILTDQLAVGGPRVLTAASDEMVIVASLTQGAGQRIVRSVAEREAAKQATDIVLRGYTDTTIKCDYYAIDDRKPAGLTPLPAGWDYVLSYGS